MQTTIPINELHILNISTVYNSRDEHHTLSLKIKKNSIKNYPCKKKIIFTINTPQLEIAEKGIPN